MFPTQNQYFVETHLLPGSQSDILLLSEESGEIETTNLLGKAWLLKSYFHY